MYGYTNAATWPELTADQLIQTMKRITAELDAKFPKSERCKSIEVDLESMAALLRRIPPTYDIAQPDTLYGLPVLPRFDVPRASWIGNMADGSRVTHYPDGRKVRCLPGE